MWYYKTAIKPITMAIIQMRQPHEVEQPSPRKSNIHPPIFKPQPRRLKANRPRMIIAMIPMISITILIGLRPSLLTLVHSKQA